MFILILSKRHKQISKFIANLLMHIYTKLKKFLYMKFLVLPWQLRKICCIVVVALLFYVHGKHLRSCRDGQLT